MRNSGQDLFRAKPNRRCHEHTPHNLRRAHPREVLHGTQGMFMLQGSHMDKSRPACAMLGGQACTVMKNGRESHYSNIPKELAPSFV